jgi:hypothetical protein
MNFALANKAPITVTVGGKPYALKRFGRGDWIRWASEIDGERAVKATEGLDPIQRSKMLLIYGVEPTLHSDLERRVFSPEGTGRIIRVCCEKSGIPKDVVETILDEETDERDLETLATMLASIIDTSKPAAAKADGGEDQDPLQSSAAA